MIRFSNEEKPLRVRVPLVSLLDIILLLLIYFLLTTNFISNRSLTIQLPKAQASSATEQNSLTLTLDKDGRLFFEEERIEINEVSSFLQSRIQNPKEAQLVLRADEDVDLLFVVEVFDRAKALGIRKLSLATEGTERE